MGLLYLASGRIIKRGYDYFQSNKVKNFEEIDDYLFRAVVSGTEDYDVEVDMIEPEVSTCTCQYAKSGKICKHMVAVYYKGNPDLVKAIEEEKSRRREKHQEFIKKQNEELNALHVEVENYVYTLSNDEIKKQLIEYIFEEKKTSIVKEFRYHEDSCEEEDDDDFDYLYDD